MPYSPITYGRAHRQLRRSFAPQVAAGTVLCARCGKLIAPGAPWDLGHIDGSTSEYAGPEHRACNRATQTHMREARVPRTSRAW